MRFARSIRDRRQASQRVGSVELFAKPITLWKRIDGYRFAPPILHAEHSAE
jgi:hypothetical protein